MILSPKENIEKILENDHPSRIAYAPNYWQWFEHHKNHSILPNEIKYCETQLDLFDYLGLDVFSRNIYCRQDEAWFGGICDEYFEDVTKTITISSSGNNKVTQKEYLLGTEKLTEKLMYVFDESTIVQREFLISDYKVQGHLLEKYVASRKWKFNPAKFEAINQKVGEKGVIIVGDFFSPLKMLHMTLGPVNTVYFLMEEPEFAKRLLDLHEKAQLELVRQCVNSGVRVIMAMDNLDTMFHPPFFVEAYSASFYEKASAICHEKGCRFFIHACGNQKDNLQLISSLNVDGLEGFAFPPLGDIQLEEAMKMTHGKFTLTGGISPMETRDLQSKKEIFSYVENLFTRMKPYANRFIFSSSCNTAIDAKWETIKHFRDAWLEFRN